MPTVTVRVLKPFRYAHDGVRGVDLQPAQEVEVHADLVESLVADGSVEAKEEAAPLAGRQTGEGEPSSSSEVAPAQRKRRSK